MTYTLTDLFCGAGGSMQGAMAVPGVQGVIAANHWRMAIDTHAANFPDLAHDCADISQVRPQRYPYTDILWASPECFTAGHLVTTSRGQLPIEDVQVGDVVLTHLGRWRPVVRVQEREAPTVAVRGQGHTGIETTASHRFWLRTSSRKWMGRPEQYKRQYAEPGWLEVGYAVEREALWATPTAVEPLPTQDPPSVFGLDTTAAWWLVGRWVGDGSLSFGRNHEVAITCGFHESVELGERLADTGTAWTQSTKRTSDVFSIGDRAARDWLLAHFGHGAAHKQLPTWVLSLPRAQRRALLDGYLSADGGGMTQRRVRCSTVSRALAVSVRLLAESLGHRVSMTHDKRTSYSIEGRDGVARLQWILHWEPELNERRAPEAFDDGRHAWSRVREVAPASDSTTVYNIEVEEDHSYVLDGVVVANCTNHSQAKGRKRQTVQGDLFGDTLPDEAADRSRATMWDVPRFCEVHPYRAVIVENVVDAARWVMWDAWLMAMQSLGYSHRTVWLNSMHAPAQAAPRAPQSRDRLYVVFWRKGDRAPDIEPRPLAWCSTCSADVHAIQSWKRPDVRWGRYRAQYVYRCPRQECRYSVVEPYADPAAAAIDWTLSGQRIGDRDKPLSEKTVARISAGLERYARPMTFEARGNTYVRTDPDGRARYARAWPVDQPTATLHTTESRALVVPSGGTWRESATGADEPFPTRTASETDALVVPVEGRDGKEARPSWEAMRTQTARAETALVVPYYSATQSAQSSDEPLPTQTAVDRFGLAFVAELHGGGSTARDVREPLATVLAGGNHHMLVRHNTSKGDGGEMCTPVAEPARTVTTKGHQSVVGWDGKLPAVEDCTFRMLEPREIQAAMAFGRDYRVLGNRREQVRQLGNGVTPPAAEFLIRAVVDALEGEVA